MDPYQFYPREWIENSKSPVLYVIFADHLKQFMEDQEYEPLTDKELEQLPIAVWETEFLDEVLETLRPGHRDRSVCA